MGTKSHEPRSMVAQDLWRRRTLPYSTYSWGPGIGPAILPTTKTVFCGLPINSYTGLRNGNLPNDNYCS